MKKATLTIGLFTLALASTSFATPKNSIATISANTISTPIDGTGSQDAGGNKKTDSDNSKVTNTSSLNRYDDIDGSGSQDAGGNRKHD